MAAAKAKATYTAAEVAALEDKIQQQQNEIEELKRKLDHMNEVFPNAQRARFGQSSEKDTGFAHIKSLQAPAPLMKHSLASASSVANIMTKKYVDGLPLARQEKIWAREGVQLSRATMQSALPGGRWCGGERPECGLNGRSVKII